MEIEDQRLCGVGVGGRMHLQAHVAHDDEHDSLRERGESARKQKGQRSDDCPDWSFLPLSFLGCLRTHDAASFR